MKRNVIISGIAVLAVSTGIISYMVSAQQPQQESVQSNVETITVPEAQDIKVESTPTETVVTEAPAPVQRESSQTPPTASKPSITREEVSGIIVSTLASNWNPKETGIMISSSNITALLLKTYDASPEAFTSTSTKDITLQCVDKIKSMDKDTAVRFVFGDSCL